MPKLWVLSDLHLEALPYPDAFKPSHPEFDVLVAAGDIWQGDFLRGFRFLRNLAGTKPIVCVMGNHEHWNGVLDRDLELAKVAASNLGITLLAGDHAVVEACTFVGSTLWADQSLSFKEFDPSARTGELIDIADNGGTHRITVGDAITLHRDARTKLEHLVVSADRGIPLVVVTHHAPHPDCLIAAMRGTWSAGNSASDLTSLLDGGNIGLWVHGHVHHSVDIVRGRGTRILCNPAGALFGNGAFDEALVVEV